MNNQLPMPYAVRMSAYCNRRTPIAMGFGKIQDYMFYALGAAVFLVWWIYVYWLLIRNIDLDFITDRVPGTRTFIIGSFAVCFVWGVLGHWLDVVRSVPRADPSYPLVGDAAIEGEIRKLSYHMLAFSAVLLATVKVEADLWPAVTLLVMGCLAFWYGLRPPSYGYVPYAGNDKFSVQDIYSFFRSLITTLVPHLLTWLFVGMVCAIVYQFYPDVSAYIGGAFFWGAVIYYGRKLFGYGDSSETGSTVFQQPQQSAQQAPAPGTDNATDYTTPIKVAEPKTNFSNIYGMQAIKDKLFEPAQLIIAERKPQDAAEPPANGILLFGEPGNGKTVFAEALAGELKVPFVLLTYGDVSSKWLGEKPRTITNCFAYAKQHAPCVLFVDEVDSFIRSRDAAGSSEETLKITNTLLTEIVNLRDHRVVLIGATNYLANLDAAAIREGRFDYKIEITAPDEEARIGILQKGAAKHAKHLNVDQESLLSVAKRWNGFSVSRLLAVVKALPRYAKDNKLTDIGHDEWMRTLREVQGRNGRVPQNTKSLNELVLDTVTREALDMVGSRLMDVERIESLGGTLPSGVLFHGPSGTGKTAAARALAKEVGWAFLSVAGPDLIADREKISKLYAEAKDIRPCIIFIDEADDVLRNRQYSNSPDLTNRMLVLMDGTDEKVKDVVFIAATNHPDQIDPALLRAGRFTEKVEFMPPPQDQIPKFVSHWLQGKKVMLDAGLDAWEIAGMLEGQTIANIEGVLQYALNRAISRQTSKEPMIVNLDDMKAGVRVVLTGCSEILSVQREDESPSGGR